MGEVLAWHLDGTAVRTAMLILPRPLVPVSVLREANLRHLAPILYVRVAGDRVGVDVAVFFLRIVRIAVIAVFQLTQTAF